VRFTTVDPIRDGANWFAYVNNDPVNYVDLLGLLSSEPKRGFWSKALDGVQAGLDVVGFVPGVGEIADGINALISLGRGDVAGAALSAMSMVPIVGDAIGKGGKQTVENGNDMTMMPILVGGLVGMDITEKLYTHVRVTYGDNLASESAVRASEVVISPRIHYKTESWGELRLDPGFTFITTDSDTNFGFSVGVFWEYKF